VDHTLKSQHHECITYVAIGVYRYKSLLFLDYLDGAYSYNELESQWGGFLLGHDYEAGGYSFHSSVITSKFFLYHVDLFFLNA